MKRSVTNVCFLPPIYIFFDQRVLILNTSLIRSLIREECLRISNSIKFYFYDKYLISESLVFNTGRVEDWMRDFFKKIIQSLKILWTGCALILPSSWVYKLSLLDFFLKLLPNSALWIFQRSLSLKPTLVQHRTHNMATDTLKKFLRCWEIEKKTGAGHAYSDCESNSRLLLQSC